jgi:hypothetical protein
MALFFLVSVVIDSEGITFPTTNVGTRCMGLTSHLAPGQFNSDKQRVFMVANQDGAIVLDIGGVTDKGKTGRLIKV